MPFFTRPLRTLSLGFLLLGLAVGAGGAEPAGKKRPGGKATGQPRQRSETAPWWREIDTGPFIADTFLDAPGGEVAALKGVAIRLGSPADASVLFDTELLAWRAGFDGAVLLEGSPWSGSAANNSHVPAAPGGLFFKNTNRGRGFGIDGDWSDPREFKAGPLPHGVGRYKGLYRHGRQVVLHYRLAGTDVLELPALETVAGTRALTRTLNLGATAAELALLVSEPPAPEAAGRVKAGVTVFLVGAPSGFELRTAADGRMTVVIPRGSPASRFKIVYAAGAARAADFAAPDDLAPLTRGGPGLYPDAITVKGQPDPAAATKTYAVDTVPLPVDNPWQSPPRFGGFDFFADGRRLAASTWNGDVWIADGIAGDLARVTWRRFASGMFQTLGLKIVDGKIYTQGRDQLTRLHDLNGDGEADHYECFNNDVMITTGFHEFSFDLQTDRAGNFYFSKAMPVSSGGRGFTPWTPHNGTVMKVSPDGAKLEVVAWGLRAPGGVGVSADGTVTTGENEGSWVPACKITWTPPGKLTFNGVVPGRWNGRTWEGPLAGAPTDYDRPLLWLPYFADNSGGSQLWVPENTAWDPRHAGELLHLSYGKSSVFRVLRDEVNGTMQGSAYRLPIDVSAAVMRGRFHPTNGQLYVVGFRGWQTSGRDALQRVRYTGRDTALPVAVEAHANGLLVRFSAPLDAASAQDPARYSVSKWNYVWGPQYGSGRFSIDQRDAEAEAAALIAPSKGVHNLIDAVAVGAARVLDDGRSVFLYLPKMTPAMQLELKLDLTDAKGAPVRETIYSTVHATRAEFHLPGVRWADIAAQETAPSGEPGLVMSFNAEVTDAVRVPQLALHVPAGMAPSVFIPTGRSPFGAGFEGSLIVPERDAYTFSLEGSGFAILRIDGRVVVQGPLPLRAAAPVTLAKGAHTVFCSYQSPATGEASVRLLWSSPQFREEPVPASAFRHLPSPELKTWTRAREGRELFMEAQCVKCHRPRGGLGSDAAPELQTTVPDFADLGHRLERAWLEQWIARPQNHCPPVATGQAPDVAAYLAGLRSGKAEAVTLPADPATAARGAALVDALLLGPWIEPLLRDRKHTDAGLFAQLERPTAHHADTVFPDLRLSREEALAIAAHVRSRQTAARPAPVTGLGDPAAGKAVVEAACLACHRPESPLAAAVPALETMLRLDWAVRGCLADDRGRAPDLGLSPAQIGALLAFRNADRDVGVQSLRRFAPAEYAANQMKRLGCMQCHGAAAGSKVPDITAAGEKFDHAWLVRLLGGQEPKIRPWLEARMPAFASRAEHLALGLAAQHGLGRESAVPAPSREQAPVGAALAGEKGYSCIACHDAGSRKALQVFEGQGPDLRVAGRRLRYDYYQRWMHWPQRIAPSTIMPRYTKDRDHALLDTPFAGDAERQFEAVWQWIRTLDTTR